MNVALDRPNPHNRPVSVIVGDFTTRPVPNADPPRTYGDATPGSDYVGFAPFRLSFAPGATAASFPIQLCGDTAVEGDEHINVRIAAPDGVDIADNDISIYLRNDD